MMDNDSIEIVTDRFPLNSITNRRMNWKGELERKGDVFLDLVVEIEGEALEMQDKDHRR
jgi:SPX domain protein involved in polyphosphate accumulation